MIIENEYMERQLNIIFDNFILKEAKVVRNNGISIEVRTSENGHNVPHCHVQRAEQEVSISLIDFKTLSKSNNINAKQENAIRDLVEKNKSILRNKWEEYHGTTLLKDGRWE